VSITTTGLVVHVPFTEPLSPLLFSPEGFWKANTTLVGDASGGTLVITLNTERHREFLYLVDSLGMDCATAEGNDGLLGFLMYLGEDSAAALMEHRLEGVFNTAHGRRYFESELRPPRMLLGQQRRTGGAQGIVSANWESNVDTATYQFTAQGRYYRKSLIHQPGFLRTVLGNG